MILLESSALFSKDLIYRYSLIRAWDYSKPTIMFIGLNPSTADSTENDPTVTRCMNYAKIWGYGKFIMTNAFAYKSTDPRILKNVEDPIGPKNDKFLLEHASNSHMIVACWGNHGSYLNRDLEIKKIIGGLYCLGINKNGQPKHPLYLKKDLVPIFFSEKNIHRNFQIDI